MRDCTAPRDSTRSDTAKAARVPPKASRGRVYIFTLKAATAKMFREIPAEAQAGVGAAGMTALASATTDAARHTRKRAATGGIPRSMKRSYNHPPASPPSMANSGGIQAYHAA